MLILKNTNNFREENKKKGGKKENPTLSQKITANPRNFMEIQQLILPFAFQLH